ncbi:uncharacterized protein KY384_001332 [Bacidia gigantensis]|uniref:uncharacterized protein n=1 Tax=Bacidia gigantensis TaxID=2732470 RepID=UPI001D05666D|nr:uncharacterized protein KY384_001332 [Bacidia gigantensis]KAG8533592.1 hypothetical protein KY384_001332 [Bacidia gigantensis]
MRSRPLPDLTQGIPSTLDAEMEAQSRQSDPRSLNITEKPGSDGGRGGDIPKYEHVSSVEQKRVRFAQIAYTVLFSTILGTIIWEGRNWETEEDEKRHPEAPSGWALGSFYKRVKARMSETSAYYTEPTFPKLLPDPDPVWARPYTLVLSMEDLLVHSEWSREHGWRMAKRPGVDYFLRYLSSYYELVIWTDSSIAIGQQVYAKLDPYRVVLWPLFKEATKYENGEYIKKRQDISYLNRDPSKVIVLDTKPSHVKTQPENAIILPPWTGQPGDKDLVSYIAFLEYCASMNYKDLREVLKSFEGEHIPTSYARREAAIREKVRKQQPTAQGAKPRKSFFSSLSGGAGGQLIGPDGTELPTYAEASRQGKTYMDMVRERGQKQYEILEKEIRENGEKWLKEMADEEKKQQDEAMKSMKSSFTGFIPFFGSNRDESTNNRGEQGRSS